MIPQTDQQFEHVIQLCKEVFVKKTHDYGTAWRILRTHSLTDQIFIKARRIRSLQLKGTSKIAEDERSEFIGIVNYCAMALIQLDLGFSDQPEMTSEVALDLYFKKIYASKALMQNKNHDYDEAWRMMRISSITDLILMKLYRVKQIEDNKGQTLISEGIDANYMDMINYALFALILLENPRKND